MFGASQELAGPGGRVQFRLWTDARGDLVYEVKRGESPRLGPARLGILVEGMDLGSGVQLQTPQSRRLSGSFPWRGSKREGRFDCQAYEVPMRSGGGTEWTLEVRVFEDGMGFRYRVPGAGVRKVKGEVTAFRFPGEAVLWYQNNTGDYEGVYQSARADAVPLEGGRDGRREPLFLGPPVTAVYGDGTYGLVSEAGLYRYSGMTLRPGGSGELRAVFQDDPDGWSHEGEVVSPWRVLVLAEDLNGLVNSDLIAALCDPPDTQLFPEGLRTPWISVGKAPCTWMVFGNDGAQWERQKWFVDQCAAMGAEFLLVDAGWRTERWGWLKDGGDLWARAAELCRYAADRKVGIILWHAYPEGRDDGPGLTTTEAREELFANCRKAGVKGVKIDFFNSESKETIEAYEDLLRRAARHQLTVNFHGANKPTGEMRTWPNEVTREGIREQEYVLWDTLPLAHYGALPFTRMAVGHADFLPGYIQPRFLKNTTLMFQMAATVVFSSPFLCWPDNPEAYVHSPMLEFVRTLPVTWDETRVLPESRIGEVVYMARRQGESWYVAVLNCEAVRREVDLDLSDFAGAGKEIAVYRDGPEVGSCVIEAGLKSGAVNRVKGSLRSGGGLVVRIRPAPSFAGWR